MTYTYLTYSRDLGDFKHDLTELNRRGLYGLRLIHKGKSTAAFIDRIEELLAYNKDNNLDLQILVDLPGEKALIGDVGEGLTVEKAATYVLRDEKSELSKNEIPTCNFLNRIQETTISVGDVISIADGELEMNIVSINEGSVVCVAHNSFLLTSNRSFNVKGNKLSATPVSAGDKMLLDEIRLKQIAGHVKILVSFVTKAEHVSYVRNLSPDFRVIAKIEHIVGEHDLKEIIQLSDGVMLGRGDLISSSRMSDVFPFQKNIIGQCKALNKELIVATGLFGDLKNGGKPSISDIMDFGFLRSLDVNAFLIAGSNASRYPLETLDLVTNFEML